MHTDNRTPPLREWLKLNRIIPLLTILGAATAIVLVTLGFLDLTIPEGIIIALLGLLSIDGLTERITSLEKIEKHLGNIPMGQALRHRTEIPLIEEQTSHASEIVIMAASAVTLTAKYAHYFEEKMKQGGLAESCGLWNSKKVFGRGISPLLARCSVSITSFFEIHTLVCFSAPYTLKMIKSLGFKEILTVGDQGRLPYPTEKFLSSPLGIVDI